ncbi:MAG: VOC family protein [Armatimonadetes bacterium]|nr:VOC family protein [Armatimonadota bacterium]
MATVRYLVDDVDAVLEFYTERLGFELEKRWGPPFAILAKGDLRLWISGPQSSAAQPMPDGRKPVPGGWNRLVIIVEDLPSFVEDLRKEGVTFRGELIEGPGGKQILIEDPSGNPIELFETRD